MTKSSAPTVFPSLQHNHGLCLKSARERVRRSFEAKGLRLTELRITVFEEIASSHHAVGAYEVLERLSRKGRRLAPISVYRAIEALLGAGVIHRLESKNAFFACHVPHAADRKLLILACDQCGRVAEVPGTPIFQAMAAAAQTAHFTPAETVAEVTGRCGDCGATR